ncbi:MAG: DUF2764 family protein [Sphaerochaetaceae bacterium]
MASYYYLVASLPTLNFDQESPFSLEEFYQMCQQELTKNDLKVIESLIYDLDDINHPIILKWNNFVDQLATILSEMRSERLSRETEAKGKSDRDATIVETIKAAMQAENPLEAELILMRLQWDFAAELAQNSYFEIETLASYALQLKLALRKGLFKRFEGKGEFEHLFSILQKNIKSK